MKVAFATCSAMPTGAPDDQTVAELVGAEYRQWDDESVDWTDYDRVLLRSVWDYSARAEEFVAWCRSVGTDRLRNRPELVAWNADKRYLAQLSAPVVPTMFVAPGDDLPRLDGEVVVKPNISAGARHTGRFEAGAHADALALIDDIRASGRVALVQPYMPAVDTDDETAIVFLGGRVSHVLQKRAVLRDGGIAPVAPGELEVAAAMLEDDLVGPGSADAAELSLAHAIHDEVSDRFGMPLYARVDMVLGPGGGPVLMELEVIEPALYLHTSPGSAERFAAAILVC